MMDSKTTRWALVLFLVCLGLSLAKAQVHTVSAVPGLAEYATVTEALDAAQAGDTIYVYPGSYTATINKRVVLMGPGYQKANNNVVSLNSTIINNASFSSLTVTDGGDQARIQGLVIGELTVENVDLAEVSRCYISDHILIENTHGLVLSHSFLAKRTSSTSTYFRSSINFWMANCIVDRIGGDAIRFNISTDSQGAFVNNVFTNNEYGIRNSVVKNNVFSSTSTNLTIYSGFGDNTYSHNVSRTGFGNAGIAIGDPGTQFAGRYQSGLSFDARYQLIENSSLLTAGEDGDEVGAFGGVLPYQLSGLPAIPLIYDLDMPDNAPAGQPLNVNVKVRTQN